MDTRRRESEVRPGSPRCATRWGFGTVDAQPKHAGSLERIEVVVQVHFLAFKGGLDAEARCEYDGLPDGQWSVILGGPFPEVEARAGDAFDALSRARTVVEANGWTLGLNGARVDAWPSGMARDQGGGRRVYVIDADRIKNRLPLELIDTFGPADRSLVGTVAEQIAHIRAIRPELIAQ